MTQPEAGGSGSGADMGIVRPVHGRVLGGVCAGIAQRLGLAPLIIRILFVVAVPFSVGGAVGLYVALWLLLPSPTTVGQPLGTVARAGLEEMQQLLTGGRAA